MLIPILGSDFTFDQIFFFEKIFFLGIKRLIVKNSLWAIYRAQEQAALHQVAVHQVEVR